MDRQTYAAHLQHLDLLQPGLVHYAVCSRAGLVAIAQLRDEQGMLVICSLVSAQTRLQVLRQISTGKVALNLAMSPNGLLLNWTDSGSQMQAATPGGYFVQAIPKVQICELATGRVATLCSRPSIAFNWLPMPTSSSAFKGDRQLKGVIIRWASTGSSLYLVGPGTSDNVPVWQINLLPR